LRTFESASHCVTWSSEWFLRDGSCLSCVDITIDHVVISNSHPRSTSRTLTFPRACDMPLSEFMIPHYGSRYIRHDVIGDDFPITIGAISEASDEDD
jgi:hypothetical protein